MKKTVLVVILWIVAALINSGFLVAEDEHDAGRWICARHRNEMAMAIGYSVIFGPIAILITPMLTGFYEFGWTWNPPPACVQAEK